jgi:uncharacterized membrane protein YqjE
MTDPAPSSQGLGRRLRHLGDLALGLVENRLALAACEIAGRLQAIQRMLAWSAMVALCAALALQALALGVIVWFWDSHRMAAILSVAAFFVLAALAGGFVLRHQWRHGPKLLEGSLEELRADRAQWSGEPRATSAPSPVPPAATEPMP